MRHRSRMQVGTVLGGPHDGAVVRSDANLPLRLPDQQPQRLAFCTGADLPPPIAWPQSTYTFAIDDDLRGFWIYKPDA